jgi:hypothetical protein
VTLIPGRPASELRKEITGGDRIVKRIGLLAVPPELVTIRLPVVAPEGTGARTPVEFQLATNGAFTPLKLTEPMLFPRLEPETKI